MKVLRSLFFIVVLLAPFAALGFYTYLMWQQCQTMGAETFPCRILLPAAYAIEPLGALLGILLGFCLGYKISGLKRLTAFYLLCLLGLPAVFAAYHFAPEGIREEYFEGRNEEYCASLAGREADMCYLTLYRNRIGVEALFSAWCDNIKSPDIKARCAIDISAGRGEGAGCTKITDKLPALSHSSNESPATVAMEERVHCYKVNTFAKRNALVNHDPADFKFEYNDDICLDEPREIAKNYCLLRLGSCSLINNSVIAGDCNLYKKMFLQ